MSALEKISVYQNRRDEVPNQELARELADRKDRAGIAEIAANLWNKEKNVQSDCLKVLYETGYLDPSLIAEYVQDFLKLLQSRNNRMVWGAMIALSTIAELKADVIFPHLDELRKVMESGSVITVDSGTRTLSRIAGRDAAYNRAIFPYLLNGLGTCRPGDVPRHAEMVLAAVNPGNRAGFVAVLEKRMEDLSASQVTRLKKVLRAAGEA
jgi:hypothetical protein